MLSPVLGLSGSVVKDRSCPNRAGSHMGIDQIMDLVDLRLLMDTKAYTS